VETPVNKSYVSLGIALGLIALAVLLRVLPHPDNFAPVAAVAIFGGAVLPRRYAVITPLAAMIISDWVIGFHDLIVVTWGCYALIAFASSSWLRKRTLAKTTALTIGGSLFFFFVTNFAVWAQGRLYPLTLTGLKICFIMALPFFRNTALSDVFFTASLFGLYALATRMSSRLFKLSKTN